MAKEVGNVTFPTKDDVKLTSLVVLILVLVFVIFISFTDFFIAKLTKILLGIYNGL
ncbi:MAG: preprotein translocase subunit SecE [Rickettsiales bacterium]|nr:preprotein translocase subunit SecE [Rickettsiales bacterium]